MAVRSDILRAPGDRWWWRPVVVPAGWLGTAALAFGTGLGAAAVATHFQRAAPLILIALFVAPLLAIAILVNPLIAIFVVLATFPVGSIAHAVGPIRLQAVE